METKMRTKSALSYFGSDSEVAADLAAMLDHCKHVTIPFCGGMSILPHLKARAVVANDLNDLAINFYRCMGGFFGEKTLRDLISLCEHTLSHPSESEEAERMLANSRSSPLLRAWAYWALCWIGRKGKGGTKHLGGLPSVRRTANGGNNATRIRAAADDLKQWAKHFERCEFESIDFRELLPKVADKAGCGIYCDPPFVGAGRNYLHAFSKQDHQELAELLKRFASATVVVRYGDDPLIRQLYDGWHIIERDSRTQANKRTSELWITNREVCCDAPNQND